MREFSAEQYIRGVLDEKITVCQFVRQAVFRHVRDLERAEGETFPYRFDEEKAKVRIRFCQLLVHIKGEWAVQKLRFKLEPWQQFIVWELFGWVRKDNGARRFRDAYIEVARKNGKSFLMSAIALSCLFLDRDAGLEIYCAATKRDQAKLVWSYIEKQIRRQPEFNRRCRIFSTTSTIVFGDRVVKALGADSDTEDGLNPSLAIIDEEHAMKDSRMIEVLKSGMGARTEPLLIKITTAGSNKQGPAYSEDRDLALRVLSGTEEKDDFFCIMYELDQEDDWTDPNVWLKANPNLGVSIYPNYLPGRVEDALKMPSRQAEILTKNFNKWVDSGMVWIPDEKWQACIGRTNKKIIRLDDFVGRKCHLGLDLSDNIDLSALSIVFPPVELEKKYSVFTRFFMPELVIDEKSRTDHVPYAAWKDSGWIIGTPGNTIDQDWIETFIRKLADDFQVVNFGYDPWNARQLVAHLEDDGMEMVEFRQGFATLSAPTKEFEKAVLDQTVQHEANPVMGWNVSCVELECDPAGNVKPSKKKLQRTGRRIDGVIATLMALSLAQLAKTPQYESDRFYMA